MRRNRRSRAICCGLVLLAYGCAGATRAVADDRYAPLVESILAAWSTFDVVCLGEGHGHKHDSDLRLALVRHPSFPRAVDVVVVEFANPAQQALLDRFILDGAAMARDEIAPIWRDANGAEVWESPIYEAFLRAVREVNLGLPREERVRVLGGDTAIDWRSITRAEQLVPLLEQGLMNRGGNIRKLIAEQVLDKKLKALAIYGSGHCVKVGMGFPGELADRYPGRMWSVYNFFGEDGMREGQRVFGLGDKPAYIPVTGTRWAPHPAGVMFQIGQRDLTLGDMLDAIVYYGDVADVVVPADPAELESKYGPELERRRRLLDEALRLQRRP